MERLTERSGDVVFFIKDGIRIPAITLGSIDTRKVLERLAYYEDIAEMWEYHQSLRYAKSGGYENGKQ